MIQIDSEAHYAAVVEEFADMVYRIAFQNLLQKADAEDVVQEVFVKLLNHRGNFESREHLKAWLIRVTVNQCRDFSRALFRIREVAVDDMTTYEAGICETPEASVVLAVLQKLTKPERCMIHLCYYEGYTIREAAKILRKNENTAGSLLRRGREKLGRLLREEGLSEQEL